MKLKNTLKYNRALGIAVLVLIIPLTLFLKANLSLRGEESDLKKVYANEMKTAVKSCADGMNLFVSEAEHAGLEVSGVREAVRGFSEAAGDPFSVGGAAETVFPLLKQTHDRLKTENVGTALTERYYNTVGASLRDLSQNGSYAKACAEYEKLRSDPIAGKITLPAKEATDFDVLFQRYGSDFDLTVIPEEPEIVSLLGAIVRTVLDIVSGVVGWILHAVWWIVSRLKGIPAIVIVIGILWLCSGAKQSR